jgi:ubiquinone/menaquinone biosynthesis C-methylase UbiE
MAHRVCPWWLGYFLLSPLRRWRQDPRGLLAPYVRAGMTALEPGPGMGFFTLELARLVGPTGRVVAVDVQSRMLDRLRRRAARAGVGERVQARRSEADSMGLTDLAASVDFTLAFAVLHEMPSAAVFFAEAAAASRPGALLLLAEPSGHVTQSEFDDELWAAAVSGFVLLDRPGVRGSLAALLRKDR